MNLPSQFLLLLFAGWINRQQQAVIDYLIEENRVLREQLGKRRLRFIDPQLRRLAEKGKALGRAALGELNTIVTPDTILRWYRNLVAKKYDGSCRRGPGRPATVRTKVEDLVVRMARENPTWGYTRIRGALRNLGHEVGRNTIARLLSEHGLDLAPERSKRTSWTAFLKAHWGAIAAIDFFTVEVLTMGGLVRYFVLFTIDLKTRRVHIAGITNQPHDAWMQQVARNLTDNADGFLRHARYLIMDRDLLFSKRFRAILKATDLNALRLPARSPNLNAYAERFVRSIKSECLRRMVPLGERHLQNVVREYVEHYHLERNHQGVGNELLIHPSRNRDVGRLRKRERLGSTLNFYFREAA